MFDTQIPIYGIFIVLSIISILIFAYKNSKYLFSMKEEKICFLVYIVLGIIIGAKYFSYFMNYDKYNGEFNFVSIGFSSYGGVVGMIIMLLIFSKQFKKNMKDLLSIICPLIPLMYGIGKIGCFFSGCCHGIKYTGVFNVIYNYSNTAPKGIALFPVQLLEAIIFILIFIYIMSLSKKSINNNMVIGKTFVLCGFFKFILDFFRMSHVNIIMSINQVISLLFVLIGIGLILKKVKRS